MRMDKEFAPDKEALRHAIDLLGEQYSSGEPGLLPSTFSDHGIGSRAVLDLLAPLVLGGAARLDAPTSFAHMDPPTPWVTWATTLWNASLNQNLLHPATSPTARLIEEQVVHWLAPFFGMAGGHMTPGSTLANLTALWAARECAAVKEVIAAGSAHMSVGKAAHLLGLRFRTLPTDSKGAMLAGAVPEDMALTALVLTAGSTSTGSVDPLSLAGKAAWTHVDAAWAGPLRISQHSDVLDGIEDADSVSVSAHKWLFQPKESALIFFKDPIKANEAISFDGPYLSKPNVGILGSHSAMAVPLMATLLAWGRSGLATRIGHCMDLSARFSDFVRSHQRLSLFAEPETGIVVWRPRDTACFDQVFQRLPQGSTSMTTLNGERWFRNVAANPNVDLERFIAGVLKAFDALP